MEAQHSPATASGPSNQPGLSHLYYSEDGLTWRPVDNSPAFGKPLLQITDNGDVIAVDEHQVEDRTADTATVHTIKTP